jgi:GTP cyclohydrolase I
MVTDSDGKIQLTWQDVDSLAGRIAADISYAFPDQFVVKAYPVPRGGIHALALVREATRSCSRPFKIEVVESLEEADVVVDDIIDSGATMERFSSKPFYALIDKRVGESRWWVFPWERMSNEDGPEENIRRIIEYVGDDPNREGLLETPSRVIRSYDQLFGGYRMDPTSVIKTFEDGSCDEMVIMRDCEVFSTCEHHMLPFFGRAHIAYIPNGKVLGASKLVRILEIFSRRLQIQERLCQQVTATLDSYLKPKGSACVIEAQHFCMTSRGVQKQHSMMVTSSLTGVFLEKGNEARQEFLSMIR